ncbi:MAG: universal stress protein [Candidatus Magnetomorum sp.]|nr:universal stress protein [Candidatus Magnetomorum sp.]
MLIIVIIHFLHEGRGTLKHSILIVLKDSISSREAIEYISLFPLCKEDVDITLLHIFRKTSMSEELMGENFIEEETKKWEEQLEHAKKTLVSQGLLAKKVHIKIVSDPYPTVADGILDQFKKGNYGTLVLGHKRKSRAEEFVKGDISMKLLRNLEGVAILSIT